MGKVLLLGGVGVDTFLGGQGGAPRERGVASACRGHNVHQESPLDGHTVLALNGGESDVGVACTKNYGSGPM